MTSVCSKRKTGNCFHAKVSVVKLVDFILSTVLSNDGGFEKKPIPGWKEVHPNTMSQFSFHDHVSTYSYRKEHYKIVRLFVGWLVDFSMRSCILSFVDRLTVLSPYLLRFRTQMPVILVHDIMRGRIVRDYFTFVTFVTNGSVLEESSCNSLFLFRH